MESVLSAPVESDPGPGSVACPRGCGFATEPRCLPTHVRSCLHPYALVRLVEIGRPGTTDPARCWPWHLRSGEVASTYGQLHRKRVHVISLEIKIGRKLRRGEWALHTCDHPPCFNPDHLYIGNGARNVRDMIERRRGPRGSSVTMTTEERSAMMRGERGERARAARWAKHRRPRVDLTCAWCGHGFRAKDTDERRFCSAPCAAHRWELRRLDSFSM